MAQKYAQLFVRGHYLFREANSFPSAKLEENCELRGTDNVQGQISENIFAPNGCYCLYYPSNRFRNARSFENWGIFNNFSPLATDTEVTVNSCFSSEIIYPRKRLIWMISSLPGHHFFPSKRYSEFD